MHVLLQQKNSNSLELVQSMEIMFAHYSMISVSSIVTFVVWFSDSHVELAYMFSFPSSNLGYQQFLPFISENTFDSHKYSKKEKMFLLSQRSPLNPFRHLHATLGLLTQVPPFSQRMLVQGL